MEREMRSRFVHFSVPRIIEVISVVVRIAVIRLVEGWVAVHVPRSWVATKRRLVAALWHCPEAGAGLADDRAMFVVAMVMARHTSFTRSRLALRNQMVRHIGTAEGQNR